MLAFIRGLFIRERVKDKGLIGFEREAYLALRDAILQAGWRVVPDNHLRHDDGSPVWRIIQPDGKLSMLVSQNTFDEGVDHLVNSVRYLPVEFLNDDIRDKMWIAGVKPPIGSTLDSRWAILVPRPFPADTSNSVHIR